MTWGPDPLLTSLGITQAEAARSAWEFEVPFGIPTPEQCYASPLHRALSTWDLTFNVDEILGENKKVIILEVNIPAHAQQNSKLIIFPTVISVLESS